MLPAPHLVFLGDVAEMTYAKTAFGLRDWAGDRLIGEWALPTARVSLGLPQLTPAAARAAGARSMVIGIAPVGGALTPAWRTATLEAIDAGLDIVSGMHSRLNNDPELRAAADRAGVRLHDVRQPSRDYPVGTGLKRTGRRLLTVGTDCALGKKYTALALTKAIQGNGGRASFRATGQTGIMIAGAGVPLDAVVADFVAGAAETLSPDNDPDHWDIIEGQGSIYHPGYAGVTVGLVHGSQPDAMVLCHDPSRVTLHDLPNVPMPPLDQAIRRYEELARLTNPAARVIAIALNTSKFDDEVALAQARSASEATGLRSFDPLRFGIGEVVNDLQSLYGRFV